MEFFWTGLKWLYILKKPSHIILYTLKILRVKICVMVRLAVPIVSSVCWTACTTKRLEELHTLNESETTTKRHVFLCDTSLYQSGREGLEHHLSTHSLTQCAVLFFWRMNHIQYGLCRKPPPAVQSLHYVHAPRGHSSVKALAHARVRVRPTLASTLQSGQEWGAMDIGTATWLKLVACSEVKICKHNAKTPASDWLEDSDSE